MPSFQWSRGNPGFLSMEFPFEMHKHFTQGLRPDHRVPRDAEYLAMCAGGKPTKYGLIPYDPCFAPFDLDIEWPFPQLFKGKDVTLLADKDAIYTVDSNWNLWAHTLTDAYSGGLGIINAGDSWHFMDFHSTWALYNGRSNVFRTNRQGFGGGTNLTYVQNEVHVETAVDFRGRAVIGGFHPDHFWNPDWQLKWSEFRADFPVDLDPDNYMGENFVLWSSIGQSDMALLWLIWPDLGVSGFIDPASGDVHSANRELFHEMYKRNEWGFMAMPWQGLVQHMQQLGDSLVVYGEGGVSVLRPYPQPVPTMGLFKNFPSPGIASRSAAGGNDKFQIYINADGQLCAISADFSHDILGYEEYFQPMINRGSDIMISHNPAEKEFYISDEEECYVLTESGLGGPVSEALTSAQVFGDQLVGVPSDTGFNRCEYWSSPLDFGVRAVKHLSDVQVAASSTVGVYAAAAWRIDHSSPFTKTDWVPVNDEGIAHVACNGVDFMVGIMCNPSTKAKVDYATARIRLCDKRGLRGPVRG